MKSMTMVQGCALLIAALVVSGTGWAQNSPPPVSAPGEGNPPPAQQRSHDGGDLRESEESASQDGGYRVYIVGPNRERRVFEVPGPVGDFSYVVRGPQHVLKQNRYVIGVILEPLQQGIATVLGIEEGTGMLVRRVLPDQPAAKAGVQQYDVLLKVNGDIVRNPRHLMEAAEESEGEPLTLTLRREGEELEVDVTPREEEATARMTLRRLQSTSNPMAVWPGDVQVVGPGMMLPSRNDSEFQELKEQLQELARQQKELADEIRSLKETRRN